MSRPHGAGLVLVVLLVLGALGWCAVLGFVLGVDPMAALEIGTAALVIPWSAIALRELVASHRVAAALAIGAYPVELFGVRCLATPGLGADALVVGAIRPRIYIGESLLDALTDEELMAVVYHEDHHCRVLAPLRAAGLSAWLPMFGRFERVRRLVGARLADLEAFADADAIQRGSTPQTIARALLKSDQRQRGVAFSSMSGLRVEALLARADGSGTAGPGVLPYEWLPIALLSGVAVVCHVGLFGT